MQTIDAPEPLSGTGSQQPIVQETVPAVSSSVSSQIEPQPVTTIENDPANAETIEYDDAAVQETLPYDDDDNGSQFFCSAMGELTRHKFLYQRCVSLNDQWTTTVKEIERSLQQAIDLVGEHWKNKAVETPTEPQLF